MSRSTVPSILGFSLVFSAILGGACSFPDFTTTSWSSGAGGASGTGGASSSGTGGASSSSTGGSPPTCDGGVPLCDGGACSCDCDGDGQLSHSCEPDLKKADCNDAVKDAKHGQTECSASPVVPGTKNYDWNCDGESAFCFTDVVKCVLVPCDDTVKWASKIPACGDDAATATCVPGGLPGTCKVKAVGMRTQTCL